MSRRLCKPVMLSPEFHDWLAKQGAKGETFEDILRRLIKYEERGKHDRAGSGIGRGNSG